MSVADYKARGILPEAMRNYLALLGWAPRDGIEIKPIEEMVGEFRLEDVNPAPAFFDQTKLLHINAHYVRELPTDEFVRLAAEFLPPGDAPRRALDQLAALVQERVRTLDEVPGMLEFLWLEEPAIDEGDWGKVSRDGRTGPMLDAALERARAGRLEPRGDRGGDPGRRRGRRIPQRRGPRPARQGAGARPHRPDRAPGRPPAVGVDRRAGSRSCGVAAALGPRAHRRLSRELRNPRARRA